MVDRIKVAAAQIEPRIFDKEGNVSKCIEAIKAAAAEKAQLVALPECALTGYCFSSLEEAMPLAEPVPGPSTEKIADACQALGVYAIVGLLEKDADKYYNTAAILGPKGLVGKYRKIHLPYLGIDRFLKRGRGPFEVYETEVGRIGVNICYDGSFPESARVMALEGAEVIVLPTNWPQGREKMPRFVIPTRALENRVNYVAVNRVGEERGFTFIGNSKIVDSLGNTLAEADSKGKEIIYAELDLAAARKKRVVLIPGQFEYDSFSDRRPEFYKAITATG